MLNRKLTNVYMLNTNTIQQAVQDNSTNIDYNCKFVKTINNSCVSRALRV